MEDSSTAYELGRIIGGIVVFVLVIGCPILFIIALIQSFVNRSKGWIATAVISGLLCLTFLGVGIFFATRGIMDGIRKSNELHVFQTSDGIASVTGPGGWRKQSLDSPDASLQVGNLVKEEYMVIISESRLDFEEEFTLRRLAGLALEITKKEIVGAQITEPAPLRINGLPAFQAQVSGTVDGLKIDCLNTYVEGKEHFYQILSWTLASKRATAFPRIKKAVGTFHELPQNQAP